MSQYQNPLPLFKKTDKTPCTCLQNFGRPNCPVHDDICANRHRDNEESRKAFCSIKDRLTKKQKRVLYCINTAGDYGATVDELAYQMNMTPNEVSPRISELHIKLHKIEKIGTRLTRRGHPAAVWRAV